MSGSAGTRGTRILISRGAVFATPLSLIFASLFGSAFAVERECGTIVHSEGTVEVLTLDRAEKGWQHASAGRSLFHGDQLRTGKDGIVKVTLFSESGNETIEMWNDAHLYMKSPAVDTSTGGHIYAVLLELQEGFLRWWTGAPGDAQLADHSATVAAGTRDGFAGSDKGGAHLQRILDNQPKAPPEIRMSESNYKGTFLGTWTWDGQRYRAKWNNGAQAELNLEFFDRKRIVITRHDTSGPSTGLKARYEARIDQPEFNTDGGWNCKILDGKATWTFADGREFSGTWEGEISSTVTGERTTEMISEYLTDLQKEIELVVSGEASALVEFFRGKEQKVWVRAGTVLF